ncbi:hypothetical protein AGMMS49525_08380 [Bacteroidia bacterium]|nr:hypothetical protein AGMMS49525_08380 [Bacteroidia bacterium]
MENQIYNGVVSFYHIQKHFGFIECDNNSYYFFIDTGDIKAKNIELRRKKIKQKIKTKYNIGDEVNFKLKYVDDKKEAYDIEYLGNAQRQLLVNEAEEKLILVGYLKKVDDNFFVKHISTYLFIPVKISKYEIDIDSVYENRINQLIQFQLENTKKIDNLKAVLVDRKFRYDWNQIQDLFEKQEIVSGLIKHRTKGGLIVDILGSDAFLPGSQIDVNPIRDYDALIGKTIEFKVIKINKEFENIVISHKVLIEEKLENKKTKLFPN